MPVTDIITDLDNRTLTILATFAAPVERVWELYADPRQLELVWGPPSHPATFVAHSLTVGSRTVSYMTGPDGERFAGWWRVTAVDEPLSFAFDDGFADADFNDVPDLPVSHNVYSFERDGDQTKARFVATYDSADDLQKVLDMGVEEGTRLALGQVDAYLAQHP